MDNRVSEESSGTAVLAGVSITIIWNVVSTYKTTWYQNPEHSSLMLKPSSKYTGHFIMFSMITNIYNKTTKRPTLMEFFTATGNFFFTTRDVRCVHHGWHGTHRYDIQVLATHASTLLTRMWQELEYRINVCHVPRGAHLEHL